MIRETSSKNMKIRPAASGSPLALSLFSGCGGFCEGMRLAGFEVAAAVEADRYAAQTYRQNFPEVELFEQDVREFSWPQSRHSRKQVDAIFGGPPCQGFSQIGTRDLKDGRNQLYMEFVRILEEAKPRIFLMENVPNLLLMKKGYFRDLILSALRDAGYSNATFIKVTASDFGVPQNRNRVVFIGTRDEDRFPYDLREFLHSQLEDLKEKKPTTVWEAIGDLPTKVTDSGGLLPYPPKPNVVSRFQRMMRLGSSASPYSRTVKSQNLSDLPDGIRLHNHHTKEIQARRRRLIGYLRPGQKGDSLPKSIWNGSRPEKWRRLDPDQPAYTLLANMHRDLSEFVHPKLDRWITVREAARLQSFHDGFIFAGSEWQQLKQIGNAVPPLLGYALGRIASEVLSVIAKRNSTRGKTLQVVLPISTPRYRVAASL